jgi:hypothetical protein
MVLSLSAGRKKFTVAILGGSGTIGPMIKQKTVLILPTGKVMAFTVYACALSFQQAYGGTIIPTNPVKYSKECLPIPPVLV